MCLKRRAGDDDVDLSFPFPSISSRENIVELLKDWDSSFVLSLTPNTLAYGVAAR